MRAPLSRLPLVALALLALATAMAVAAPLGWPFELFSHFRPQYAVAALLTALAFAGLRQPVWAGAAALLAVWHGVPVAERAVAEAPRVSCSGAPLGIVTANLHFTNRDRRRFADWLDQHPADLVVVQELTPAWADELNSLPAYPHRHFLARTDAYGIGVLSHWPLERIEAMDLAGDGHPSIAGDVIVDGQSLRFYALHARWPVLPSLARSRDLALERVAALVRAGPTPAVVLGDFNLTPDSPAFAQLLGTTGLRDALAGPHWRPTWLAGFWPLALRIDHVLVSDGVCIEDSGVGESIASDHRPVSARLRLPGATVAATTPPGA